MRFGEFVLAWRHWLTGAIVGITLIMTAAAFHLKVRLKFLDLFPSYHPNVVLYRRYPNFNDRHTIYLMLQVHRGDIFNFATLAELQNLTDAVYRTRGVTEQRVLSLASLNSGYLQVMSRGLSIVSFMPPEAVGPADARVLGRSALTHRRELAGLLSADNRSLLVSADVDGALDCRALAARLHEIAADSGNPGATISLAGEPIVRAYVRDRAWIIAVVAATACAGLALTCFVLLGAYTGWWVPLLTSLMAALWGLGFAALMKFALDPILLALPFLANARNLSHSVVWQRRYYATLNRLEDRHAACSVTAQERLAPGLVATVADLGAIACLAFCSIPALAHPALVGAVCLGVGILMVFIFQPILMSYLPVRPRWATDRGAGLKRQLADWGEALIERGLVRRRAAIAISVGAGALLAVELVALATVPLGSDYPGTPLFRVTAKVNRDSARIAREFPLDEGWIVLSGPPSPALDSVLAPRMLRLAERLRVYLLRDPNVAGVDSFAGRVSYLDQKFDYDFPKFYGLPVSARMADAFLAAALHFSIPGELDRFFPERGLNDTGIQVLIRNHSQRTLVGLTRAMTQFQHLYLPGAAGLGRLRLSYLGGAAGLDAAADDAFAHLLRVNLMVLMACVLALAAIWLRALRTGLLCLVCSVLASFLALMAIRLYGLGLGLDTLAVIFPAAGLGAGLCMIVLGAIKAKAAAGWSLDDSIRLGLADEGPDLLCMLMVLLVGVLPWLCAPTALDQDFAALFALVLIADGAVVLWLLPGLVSWWQHYLIDTSPTQAVKSAVPTSGYERA